jgi:hypothetical protein
MTASRLPRRTKAASASTQRVSKLLKDQIRSNYNTIQLLFNRNDTHNTGKVDSRELLNVMARCNVPMTEHQASEIVALLDPDDHGRSAMLITDPVSNADNRSCQLLVLVLLMLNLCTVPHCRVLRLDSGLHPENAWCSPVQN